MACIEAKRNTGCRDDRCPNIKICAYEYIHSANVWFALFQRQTPESFFGGGGPLLPTSVDFSLGTPGGTTRIQAVFYLCPRVLYRVELSIAEDHCF